MLISLYIIGVVVLTLVGIAMTVFGRWGAASPYGTVQSSKTYDRWMVPLLRQGSLHNLIQKEIKTRRKEIRTQKKRHSWSDGGRIGVIMGTRAA